jgi:hypothetical protein
LRISSNTILKRDSTWNKLKLILGSPDLFHLQKNFYKKQRKGKLTLMLSIKLKGKRREDKEELHIRTDIEELTSMDKKKLKKTSLTKRLF